MKTLLVAILAGAALTASISAVGAPYEDYKIQVQRQTEAKRQATVPGATTVQQDPAAMSLMQEMNAQLQQAKTVNTMTPEQMRDWIVKHTELMSQMQRQMMNDHHPMGTGDGSMHHQPK